MRRDIVENSVVMYTLQQALQASSNDCWPITQLSLLSISKLAAINEIIRKSHFDQGLKQNTCMANVSLWTSLLVLIIQHTARSEGTCSHAVIEH